MPGSERAADEAGGVSFSPCYLFSFFRAGASVRVLVYSIPSYWIFRFLWVHLSFLSRPLTLLLEFISEQYSRVRCVVLLLSYRFVVTHSSFKRFFISLDIF